MVISAPHSGVIADLQIKANDSVDGQDLICKIAKPADGAKTE
jgi:pyruvate carboxylase